MQRKRSSTSTDFLPWLLSVQKKVESPLRSADIALLTAVSLIERKGETVAGYRELSHHSGLSKSTVPLALQRLSTAGVISYTPGEAIIGGIATRIRRLPLSEIGKVSQAHAKELPPVAVELREWLRGREIILDDVPVSPIWSVKPNGRIYSGRPNIQGHPKEKRLPSLAGNATDASWNVFEVDYSNAEMAVIRAELRKRKYIDCHLPADMYSDLASASGFDRDHAKNKVLIRPMYSRGSAEKALRAALYPYPGSMRLEWITPWGRAVDELKLQLWREGKNKRGDSRFVDNRAGRRIYINAKKRPHKGMILSCFAQSSVADSLNRSGLAVIKDFELNHDGRLLYPLHDSLVCVGTQDAAARAAKIMKDTANEVLGIDIMVKTDQYP
jgi:hypothetical protein